MTRAWYVAPLVLALGCTTINTPKRMRHDTGTTTPKTWCDPSRGLPGDPSLGVIRPLRFGVGSIVHERDSTTETFLAARAFKELVRFPERAIDVSIVDHPSDADYSVMGVVRGDMSYARETKMGGLGWTAFGVGAAGYIVGGSIIGTGILIGAVSDTNTDTLMTIGLVSLAIGVAGNVYVGSRPSNRYSWDQTASLTLRRGSIVIGEFEVRDVVDRVQWSALDQPRDASTSSLWRQAAGEITACVAKDLAGVTGSVAKVEP